MTRDRYVVGRPLGRWQTNCYVVGDRTEGRCAVIDPGEGSAAWVPEVLEREEAGCAAILLTHGHLDHLWGVPELAVDLDVPVLLHEDDRWLWEDPGAGFGDALPGSLEDVLGLWWDPPDGHLETVKDGQVVSPAGIGLTVRHNPGHTPGHVTYLAAGLGDAELALDLGDRDAPGGVLFSGDLLFRGSVGRTDFPRGSRERLLRSLAETVLPLEDDVVVLSGHGGDTTVGRERASNPYLTELGED